MKTEKAGNSMEALENRIAPAGLVTVTLDGGVLTVNGDGAGNQLQIFAGPNGQFLINPIDDTDVGAGPGVRRTFSGPVKSIVSDLGGGNDVLWIDSLRNLNRIDITGGTGDDLILLADIGVSRGVQVDLGVGDDALDLAGSNIRIGGNLTIQGGEGDNEYSFRTLRIAVRGSLTVSGGSGDDTVGASSGILQVSKNATLALDEGTNVVVLDDFSDTQVRGNLSITGGGDVDGFGMGDGASLSVRGNLTLGLGNGENAILQAETARTSVGGTLRATAGIDADNFDFGGESFTARNLVLDPGDGSNQVALTFSAATLRNLTVSGGAGNDNIQIQGSNLTINGRLLVEGGDGTDTLALNSPNLVVRGTASFLGGEGSDDVEITGDGPFSRAVLVDVGPGGSTLDPQTINIEGGASGFVFGSSFTVRSTGAADSEDELILLNVEIRGKADIRMGDGDSIVILDDVYLRNSLLVQTNGGNDNIDIETSTLFLFDSLARKAVTIRPGAGDDEVQIGAGVEGQRVDFRARLSVIDDDGNDTINDVANANLFRPNIPPVITGFENIVG